MSLSRPWTLGGSGTESNTIKLKRKATKKATNVDESANNSSTSSSVQNQIQSASSRTPPPKRRHDDPGRRCSPRLVSKQRMDVAQVANLLGSPSPSSSSVTVRTNNDINHGRCDSADVNDGGQKVIGQYTRMLFSQEDGELASPLATRLLDTPVPAISSPSTLPFPSPSLGTYHTQPVASFQAVTINEIQRVVQEEVAASEKRLMAHMDEKFAEMRELVNNGIVLASKQKTPKQKTRVDNNVRAEVREGVKQAKKRNLDWDCTSKDQNPYSNRNRKTTDFVVAHVRGVIADVDNGSLQVAIRTYFTTCKEKIKRESSGRTDVHKKQCKKTRRKAEKLKKRTAALEKIRWSTARKGKLRRAFATYDCQSTDESLEDSAGETVLASMPRLWESNEMREEKAALDNFEEKELAKSQSLRQRYSREYRGENSAADKPVVANDDSWIIKDDEQ